MNRREKVIQQRQREVHRSLAAAYRNTPRGHEGRNEAAYDIYVDRAKSFGRARGILNPLVVMPQPRGEKQLRKGDSGKPVVVEHDIAMQIVRHVKRNAG